MEANALVARRWQALLFTDPMVRAILGLHKTETRRLRTRIEAGDVIWVREAWAYRHGTPGAGFLYRADEDASVLKWKPSLHMPRVGARLLLEALEVWREPLQAIREAGVKAEGTCIRHGFSPQHVGGGGPVDCFKGVWEQINGEREGGSWAENPTVSVIRFKRLAGGGVAGGVLGSENMKAMAREMQRKAKETPGKRKKARAATETEPVRPDMGGTGVREKPDAVITPAAPKTAQADLNGEPLPKPDVQATVKESVTFEYKSQRFGLTIKRDALESIHELDDVNEKRKKLLMKIRPNKDIEDLPRGQKAKETDDLIRAALEQVL